MWKVRQSINIVSIRRLMMNDCGNLAKLCVTYKYCLLK